MNYQVSGTMSDMQPLSRPLAAATIPIAAAALGVAGAVLAAWARAGGTGGLGSAVSLAVTITLVAAAGCVLALARPDNRVGWVMVSAGAAWGAGEGLFDAGMRGVLTAPGTVPAASALVVAGAPVRAVGWLAAALAVTALFPDGRLPGPRWRWLGWTIAGALATSFAGTLLDAHVQNFELQAAGWHNPLALTPFTGALGGALGGLSLPLMAAAIIGSVAGLISRWRRGDARLRHQLLTFAAAAALPLIVIPTAFGSGWPAWVFAACVLPLPIAVAAAILTGGVFDLATVANRSLVWGTLSVCIVGIYALIIVGAGALLGGTGARWLPWLGTAVVAVSFAPLRRVLQETANRITYGRWREPYQVLAGLSPRIAAAADTGGLLAEVVAELRDSLGLTGAALRDASGVIVAGSPEPACTVMPLLAYGRLAGDLLYCEPATPLRPADRRVLDDLAAQLALLMHARALTEDLRRARERLVLAREEERRRLRRDLHDGLGPALAGIMLKADNARALVVGEPEAAARDLVVLRDDIRTAIDDVRRVVEGLRPPAIDDLGLGPAVREMISRLGSKAGTCFSVVVPEPLPAVPAAVEVAVYRIVSEAVTNVVRHARAAACRVTISVEDQAMVAVVSDDGTGIPPGASGPCSRPGHGLVTMRERAEELGGELRIGSDGGGTSVIARLPLAAGSDCGSGT